MCRSRKCRAGRRRPSRERRHAFRMARGGGLPFGQRLPHRTPRLHRRLINLIDIIQNVDRPQSPPGQMLGQLLVGPPIIASRLRLGCLPTEIHSHKFDSRVGDQVQVALMAGDKMNIDSNALGNDSGRNLRPQRRAGQPGRQPENQSSHVRKNGIGPARRAIQTLPAAPLVSSNGPPARVFRTSVGRGSVSVNLIATQV